MRRNIKGNKITKRDITEVMLLLVTFFGFLYNDFLINAVKVYFSLGMVLSFVFSIIIVVMLFVAKSADKKAVAETGCCPPAYLSRKTERI